MTRQYFSLKTAIIAPIAITALYSLFSCSSSTSKISPKEFDDLIEGNWYHINTSSAPTTTTISFSNRYKTVTTILKIDTVKIGENDFYMHSVLSGSWDYSKGKLTLHYKKNFDEFESSLGYTPTLHDWEMNREFEVISITDSTLTLRYLNENVLKTLDYDGIREYRRKL